MKIRNGFVSNSSSSSFIIGVLNTEVCPTCGRGGTDIEDLFEYSKDYDTSLNDIDDLISHLEQEILDSKNRIEELKQFPNKKSQYYKTIQTEIDYNKKDLENVQERLETIRSYQKRCKKVYYCEVSYHDEYVNSELRSKVKSGEIMMEDLYED